MNVRPAAEFLVSLGMSINSVISLACYLPFAVGYLVSMRAVSEEIVDAQRLALSHTPELQRSTARSDRLVLMVYLAAAAISIGLGVAHATLWLWAFANGVSPALPIKLVSFHAFMMVVVAVLLVLQIKEYLALARVRLELGVHHPPS